MSIHTLLLLMLALFLAAFGLLVGLDEPQNTPLELFSDALKHSAVGLLCLVPAPMLVRVI